jgi:hypothetical protein
MGTRARPDEFGAVVGGCWAFAGVSRRLGNAATRKQRNNLAAWWRVNFFTREAYQGSLQKMRIVAIPSDLDILRKIADYLLRMRQTRIGDFLSDHNCDGSQAADSTDRN